MIKKKDGTKILVPSFYKLSQGVEPWTDRLQSDYSNQLS